MSAQSWYKDFTRRLEATNTRVSQAPSNTFDISDVARVQLGADFDPYAKLAGRRNPQSAWDHVLDWGGRGLDVLSRPGYAVGGVLNAALENKGGQVDVPAELWEGLSGKDKRFFEPAQLIDPTEEGDSGFEKAGKWVTDFLAAVATDPVSYVPGAVFLKPVRMLADAAGISGKAVKALKAGNKAVDEPDFLRSILEDAPAFNPKEPLQLEQLKPLQITQFPHGAPNPNFTMHGEGSLGTVTPNYPGPKGLIEAPPRVGVVDEMPESFVGMQGAQPPSPLVHAKPDNFDEMSKQAAEFAGGIRKPAGLSERDHLQVLQLVRDSISQSLRSIKGTFNASEVKSPWRTTANDLDLPVEPIRPQIDVPAAPQAAGQSVESSVYANAYKRHVADTAKHIEDPKAAIKYSAKHPHEDVFVPKTGQYFYGGEELDINSFLRNPAANQVGDLSTQEGLIKWLSEEAPNARINIAPTYGHSGSMTIPKYVQMFNGGEIPKTEIMVNGKSTPLSKYVEKQKAKWEGRATGASPEEMAAYEKAVAEHSAATSKYELDKAAYDKAFENYSPLTKAKPTREDLQNFLRTNKIVLSKAEKKRLLNSANLGEKQFLSTLSKLAADERRLNIESLDELADMVKSGRVDKSVLDNVYTKLGASTLGQAKKKLEVMDNAISRLQEKDFMRTKQNLAKEAARKIDAPVTEGGFNPSVVGEVPREVPDPKIPVNEVVQTADKTPSISQSEAAVDKATTPDIAAALDEESKNRVFIAAKKAVDYEWGNWKKKYPHKTNRGAGRTDTTPGMGNAHWYGEFNAKKQYTFFKYALQSVSSAAGKAEASLKGASGAAVKYDKVMPMLKAHDDLLKTYGIHPSLVPGGGYPLSLYDVLSILPRPWVERHFFNTGRQVTVDQILHIAQAAVDTKLIKTGPTEWGDELTTVANDLSGFSEVVRGILGSRWSDKNVGARAQDFAEKIGDKAGKRELDKTAKTHGFDVNNPPANYVSDATITGQKVGEKTFNKGTLAPIVNEDFIRAVQEKVAYNSARADLQYGKFVKKAQKEQVDKFIASVTAVKTNEDVFKVIDGARKSVDSQLADSATIVPTKAAAEEVKDSVDLATANATTEIASRQMAANRNATTALKAAQAEQEVSRAFDDVIQHLTPTYDLGERAQMGLMARLVHSVAPHIAEGDLRKIMLNNNVTAGHITAQYSRQLSLFQRRVGTEKANQLFNDVRLGHKPNAVDQADYDEMTKIISRIFDDGDANGWSLAGNGIHPAHLNSNLRHFQVHENFKLPTSGSHEEIYGAWRDFEANDPLDLLSRYHAAVQKTIAEKHIGAQISNTFGDARYKPGLAKVRADRGSRIAHLINTDLYYPHDVIQNMYALDRTLKELAAPNNTNKLLRLFDSATHSYKAGLTIYRPGHHMRNLYGDIWLGAMDGVYSPRYYKRAKAVMATRKEHYTDYNFNAELSDLSGHDGTALTMRVGGKEVHLSNNDVYRLAAKHGLLPNYSTIEDLGVGSRTSEIGEIIGKISPFGGKVHQAAADVSEYRDHWVRLAHFLKVMEDGKNIKGARNMGRNAQLNAIDELAAKASNRVQKWHPNGSDNTKFERNVLRRGVLFYSWIRKAIPLVLETAVLHPGRFLAFPKAMYTMAEANGIDLNGFTDPFPTDQLFPQWLGGNQGPQFGDAGDGYIGMRMGVPMMDILDQYFTNPGHTFQTIMGSTNPAIKVPFELATGSTTQGIPVDDIPKYLLGQVPFGNFANTMAGKPIGGVSPSDEGYDPGGIRDPKALATINLLSGLGLMDMSKPSYIKSGEFDVKYGKQGG